MKDFSTNLKRLMNEKRITGRALAKAIDVPFKTLQEWISAGRMPRQPEAIKKLAEYFDVSTHFLLFGEEDPHSLIGNILEKTEIHTGLYEISIKKVKTSGD
jgi:transcriptional regulator with XRE-family HTH domain